MPHPVPHISLKNLVRIKPRELGEDKRKWASPRVPPRTPLLLVRSRGQSTGSWVTLGLSDPSNGDLSTWEKGGCPCFMVIVKQGPERRFSVLAPLPWRKCYVFHRSPHFPLPLFKVLNLWKVFLIIFILEVLIVISNFASQTIELGKTIIGKNKRPINFMKLHVPQRVFKGGET